jgi:pectate lyase
VSLSGAESSGILALLMSLERPGPDVREAIEAGARWYASARLTGIRVERGEGGTKVVPDASASPLWARFYQIETNRPIFSGRDGVIRYSLAEIEPERRDGYAWYGRWGEDVARRHDRWRVRLGLPITSSLTPPTPGP